MKLISCDVWLSNITEKEQQDGRHEDKPWKAQKALNLPKAQ